MPRAARTLSEAGIYHIILKGNADQNIFEDDKDRNRFIDSLIRFKNEDLEIHQYCLMENHIHLLIRADMHDISQFMRSLASSYALYFNLRHKRHGSLFANRFSSFPVNSEDYYKSASRYIIQNPRKAVISTADTYAWSSFQQIGDEDSFIEWSFAADLFGSLELFKDFLLAPTDDEPQYLTPATRNIDDEIRTLLADEFALKCHEVKALPKAKRDIVLSRLKAQGFKVAAICRVCGLGRTIVRNA